MFWYQIHNHMQTIIYLDTLTGYKTLDVRDASMLQNHENRLTRMDKFVVCVVDLKSKSIVHKCDCFQAHRKFIDCCYKLENLDQQTSNFSAS